ncbi:MAG: hypothetical protein KDC95_01505 [Planctomycetes bacterium]|nr:hypothetical protein [Planctomycetota bacterium]
MKMTRLVSFATLLAFAAATAVFANSRALPRAQDTAAAAVATPSDTRPLRDIGQTVVFGRALRLPPLPGRREGRVDVQKTLARVREVGADTFGFPIGDGDFDWDDFQALAAAADGLGIKLWASFRLPQRGANSRPFLGGFEKWSTEIGTLADSHPSIVAVLLPELEHGRNPRFLHPPRTATLRRNLNEHGVSLLGSVYDPEEDWISKYENSLDGCVLRWTKFNQILNLTGMLAGLRAMCPPHWKRVVAFETRTFGASTEPMDPILLSACLRVAKKRTDGIMVRQLDMTMPATILPQRDGNGAHFDALKTWTGGFKGNEAK